MQDVVVFRPVGNLIWGSVAIVLDGLFLAQSFFYPSRYSNPGFDVAAAAAIGAAAALLWIRPKLVLRKDDLVVVNPFVSRVIRYDEIDELDTKWALAIRHGNRRTSVWVATASGKRRWIGNSAHRWDSERLPKSETRETEFTTASRSTDSDSGVAARLIEDRLRRLH